ncbi:MAG: sigma-54-dependent Fis family transcriptional regulator [Gemmatimonadaceae bacterium]|nr:sigma-54-dependent Fis family transcriptional regulator [Gemmatimonadaceae bacterium]NUR20315.1 sigma-54-dependent Fis family transcriptional regulator [Gemmatimonadaceae bacterium]
MSGASDVPRSLGLSAPGLADTLRHGAAAKSSIHVLVVDDDRTLREGCVSFLQAEGYNVTMTGSGDEALERVKRRRFDLILLDLYMSQVSGLEILRAALEANRDTLVTVMTGNPSVESSLEARRLGAWDYLLKPFTPTHLEVLLGRAMHTVLAGRDAQGQTARATRESGNSELVTCIGVSRGFRLAVELARKVAATDASVMISGESGTGKEVLAQVIHRHSPRAAKRMVAVNCAALPENLLESEMFGHRKGAFTGADRDKPGLLEVANGGTLFLDELTEMSARFQAKLLRVLQDGVVRRVGGETDAQVDVRFVSATNRDPQEAVSKGVLREDLFYRLRVVLIKLPPLRERVEDIPLLANHFLSHYWNRYRRTREPAPKFTSASLDLLRSKQWRGNVRELQNVIEHLAVLAEPDQPIRPDDIPFYEEPVTALGGDAATSALMDEGYYSARDRLVADFERSYLSRLVGRAGGNMSKAARLASIDRTTLYRLMERHSLHRNEIAERDSEI